MLAGTLWAAAVPTMICGCSGGEPGETREVGGYFLTVTTDPQKLAVGSDVEYTLRIQKDDQDMGGCSPGFRQYLPPRAASGDDTWYRLDPLEQGMYRGRSIPFNAAGNWELEFRFNCGDGVKKVVFSYQVVRM